MPTLESTAEAANSSEFYLGRGFLDSQHGDLHSELRMNIIANPGVDTRRFRAVVLCGIADQWVLALRCRP